MELPENPHTVFLKSHIHSAALVSEAIHGAVTFSVCVALSLYKIRNMETKLANYAFPSSTMVGTGISLGNHIAERNIAKSGTPKLFSIMLAIFATLLSFQGKWQSRRNRLLPPDVSGTRGKLAPYMGFLIFD